MNLVYMLLVPFTVAFAQPALALGPINTTDQKVEKALQLIHYSREQAEPFRAGKVIMNIGKYAAYTAGIVFAVDIGLVLTGAVEFYIGGAGSLSASAAIMGVSVLTAAGGTAVFVAGAGIYALEKAILPSPVAHAQLDDYFLSSAEGFNEYLSAPIEKQIVFAKRNPRVQAAVLGLADAIVAQSLSAAQNNQ